MLRQHNLEVAHTAFPDFGFKVTVGKKSLLVGGFIGEDNALREWICEKTKFCSVDAFVLMRCFLALLLLVFQSMFLSESKSMVGLKIPTPKDSRVPVCLSRNMP